MTDIEYCEFLRNMTALRKNLIKINNEVRELLPIGKRVQVILWMLSRQKVPAKIARYCADVTDGIAVEFSQSDEVSLSLNKIKRPIVDIVVGRSRNIYIVEWADISLETESEVSDERKTNTIQR